MVNDYDKIQVIDTKKYNNLITHIVDRIPNSIDSNITCHVDKEYRECISRNHTATHLLHASLRSILGNHVEQKGSFITNKLLRFDYSHFEKLKQTQLNEIEAMVNSKIRENIELIEETNVPFEEAIKSNSMALFGEKYGDYVRIITFD